MMTVHHIDSSVILEPENTKNGICCTRYLHLVGYKYKGKFSIPMMGELILYIIKKIGDTIKRYDTLDTILKIFHQRKIEFFTVGGSEEVFLKSRELPSHIDPMDRLLLACASKDNAIFVTLDKKLLRTRSYIKENFSIEIKHPREFLS